MIIKFVEYSTNLRYEVEKVPGARFIGPTKPNGPGFSIQMDMQTCDELMRRFGQEIEFDPAIIEWGKQKREEDLRLKTIAAQADATEPLDAVLEKWAGREFFDKNMECMRPVLEALRPDQRLGIQWLSQCPNPLLADEPGLGKTWQVIGGTILNGTHEGYNLVICPKISIENVWLPELNLLQDEVVFVAPEGRRQRDKLLGEVQMCLEDEIPFWLVVNPHMVSLRHTTKGESSDFYDHLTDRTLKVQFPFLFEVEWDNIIIDESQMTGLANPGSQFSRAIKMMNQKKRIAMSGTPMGGKPERLWGQLHWLEPKDFSTKSTWLKRWAKEISFEVDAREIKKYVGIKDNLEEEFYVEHSKYMLRRKKDDVLDIPPKIFQDIWVDFKSTQHKQQYDLMDEQAMANIMEAEEIVGRVTMANVLATNTWLKQFANGFCELEERERTWNEFLQGWDIKYRAIPTDHSPKLDALMEILQEVGADDPASGEQVLVFSQFRRTADLVHGWLGSKGVKSALITGAVTSRQKREGIISDFQKGGVYQTLVMSTKAAGVSITLDKANTVIFMDEDYDPDVQSQASDRCHRAGLVHNVTVYTIRTKGTIEEDVLAKLRKKQALNDILLDRYRQAKEKKGI